MRKPILFAKINTMTLILPDLGAKRLC